MLLPKYLSPRHPANSYGLVMGLFINYHQAHGQIKRVVVCTPHTAMRDDYLYSMCVKVHAYYTGMNMWTCAYYVLYPKRIRSRRTETALELPK